MSVETAPAASALARSEDADVRLDDVESAVAELLRRYKRALKFAADMPFLGRSLVSGAGSRWRWGSRLFTRLYVETHVRKRLQAIRACLRVELLGTTAPDDRARIEALDAELARAVEPLLRWRKLAGLVARLPAVSAALPIVSAVTVLLPVGADVSVREVLVALLWLAGTAIVLWIVVVWPSVRLGFRVKRAVFAGGRDMARPLSFTPSSLRWEGFAAGKVYEDPGKLWFDLLHEVRGTKTKPRTSFPADDVYEAENAVFRALGRRKPAEVPVDMLLGLGFYLTFAACWLVIFAVASAFASGETPPAEVWFFLPVVALMPLIPFQIVLQAIRNSRLRQH